MIKVVSHTPIECEKLVAARTAGNWIDSMRVLTPEPEKLYTWWSYRAMDNWKAADRGRRLDHIWTSDALADRVAAIKIAKDYRGAVHPSDHVPVTAIRKFKNNNDCTQAYIACQPCEKTSFGSSVTSRRP
jgi:exodeoxyribonuclease-3